MRISDWSSDVCSSDLPSTGKSFDQTIEVNEPLRYKGITVYQSSFDDGGSKLQLVGYPLVGCASQPFDIKGTGGKTTEVAMGGGREAQGNEVDISGLSTGRSGARKGKRVSEGVNK